MENNSSNNASNIKNKTMKTKTETRATNPALSEESMWDGVPKGKKQQIEKKQVLKLNMKYRKTKKLKKETTTKNAKIKMNGIVEEKSKIQKGQKKHRNRDRQTVGQSEIMKENKKDRNK